jgi:arylformamidase
VLYDITPLITPRLAVWPGDTPPAREVLCDMHRGDNITLSTLHATVHLGAHADAPSHYGRDAATIDAVPLERYLGPCQVLHLPAVRGGTITSEMIPTGITAPRILLATGTYPNPEQFNEDFASLSVRLIEFLCARGVHLVGVDTPSVDRFDSKDLPVHQACLRCDVAILEGLVLSGVPEGTYELLALPLKLAGFDASPVRAVLRTV